MNKADLANLPAFPHRKFTKEEAEKLVQMVKEAEAQRNNPSCDSSSILKVCKNMKSHETVHGLHWRFA